MKEQKKIPAGTIDCEPTWESLLPVLLQLHVQWENFSPKKYTDDVRKKHDDIKSELLKMARAADVARQHQKEINSRIILVDDEPTTIGQFVEDNTDEGEVNLPDEECEMIMDMRPGEMITIGGGAAGETIIVRPSDDHEFNINTFDMTDPGIESPFIERPGWERLKLNDKKVYDLCIDENPNPKDECICILMTHKGFWIRQHASGKFSTEAMNESAYGTFQSCVKVIEEEMGEKVI